MKILLTRHGQTEYNALGLVQGQKNVPLNETGREQARNLADQLNPYHIVKIFASPLARAKQTADIIHETLGLDEKIPLIVDPALMERDFKPFEGKALKELSGSEIAFLRQIDETAMPGVEPLPSFKRRVLDFFERIQANEALSLEEEDCLLVVTHAGVLRVVFSSILNMPVKNRSRNCLIHEISVNKYGFKLVESKGDGSC